MATNYPGSLDNFSNPQAATLLNAPGYEHDQQHANVNDAVEAIETELGANPSGSYATVVARLDAAAVDVVTPVIEDHLVDQPHLSTSTVMSVAQPVTVRSAGTLIGTRSAINFISGTNATVAAVDNAGAGRVDVTVSAATNTVAPTARRERVFTFTGDAAAARQSQTVVIYQPENLIAVKIAATTAPVGDEVIVDVLKGGPTAEASIFTERPELRPGETTAARSITYAFNPGDTIRVEIDQAGTSTPGANVTVTLVFDVTSSGYLDELKNSCQGDTVSDETNVSTGNSGGSNNAFNSVTVSGTGTIKYDSDIARLPGGFSFVHRVDSTANADAYATWTFPDVSEIFGRMYLQIDAAPVSSSQLIRFRESGVKKASIALTTGRLLQIQNTAGTEVVVGNSIIPTDTWVRIEFRLVGGPSGRIQVWYYLTPGSDVPTEVVTGTSNDLGTTWDEVNFGRSGTGGASGLLKHWQHSVAVSTRGKLGKI